jgi:thymidine kinase
LCKPLPALAVTGLAGGVHPVRFTCAAHLGYPDGMEPEMQLLRSLGFPSLRFHAPFNHFDFTRPGRRILVIGPMGSGKTEYSARVWRDAQVARRKNGEAASATVSGGADRRVVFFIRSRLDRDRFPDYPADALPYRSGYERCGPYTAEIKGSFDLEEIMRRHQEAGTWIIDEAAFYEERLAYVVERDSRRRGTVFIFPTLILNFRREIFNATARLLVETATDVFPLTAYCEHPECLQDSLNTYRYYLVEGRECPAPYFDPLIIVGGDREKSDPREPNYCTRCDRHHHLPGKEYTYLVLKPLGERAASGELGALRRELSLLRGKVESSALHRQLEEGAGDPIMMNTLRAPCLAEKALMFLYAEQNLVSRQQVLRLAGELELDRDYLQRRLADNRRLL